MNFIHIRQPSIHIRHFNTHFFQKKKRMQKTIIFQNTVMKTVRLENGNDFNMIDNILQSYRRELNDCLNERFNDVKNDKMLKTSLNLLLLIWATNPEKEEEEKEPGTFRLSSERINLQTRDMIENTIDELFESVKFRYKNLEESGYPLFSHQHLDLIMDIVSKEKNN